MSSEIIIGRKPTRPTDIQGRYEGYTNIRFGGQEYIIDSKFLKTPYTDATHELAGCDSLPLASRLAYLAEHWQEVEKKVEQMKTSDSVDWFG